ncbi:MAG: hypothetical protein MJ114_03905 [Acetatifactor sp.]|nr:hypothetical protein [Acetatifactor sp.]
MFFDGMTLTTFNFFLFLAVVTGVYYCLPRFQKYTAAVASILFYFFISGTETEYRIKLAVLILSIWGITYLGGRLIEKAEGKKRTVLTFGAIALLVGILFLNKYAYNMAVSLTFGLVNAAKFDFLRFATVIGISYYSLSAIGYLTEVSWSLYPAEKNPMTLGAFVFFFPQLISGPISRYANMKPQFESIHAFDSWKIYLGIRRMLWGYFKKLVISERFALVVNAVYGDYTNHGGLVILGATLCYAVRLFTDFSGCMDIVIGAAMLLDIELPENFKTPFLSETTKEFWQRWHMTLGNWFKDFVMYPVQKTQFMVNLGKKVKAKYGKKAGKKVPFYLATAVLWSFIGIWHGGTWYYFIASAVVPFVLLVLGDVLAPGMEKLAGKMPGNGKGTFWTIFRRVRTGLLLCFIWVFVCALDTGKAFRIMGHGILHPFRAGGHFGVGVSDLIVMVLGLVLLMVSDVLEEKGKSFTVLLNRSNLLVRTVVVYAEVILLFLFGMFETSQFIYFQF